MPAGGDALVRHSDKTGIGFDEWNGSIEKSNPSSNVPQVRPSSLEEIGVIGTPPH